MTTHKEDKKVAETTNDVPERPSLAEESGFTMADAMRAIREMNAKFEAQNEENAKLRSQLVSTRAMVEANTAKSTAARFGAVEIVKRICNNCGVDVEPGTRCKLHKRGKVNEIGMGTKHNRLQPVIVRQV
jgi:hypothetical protein